MAKLSLLLALAVVTAGAPLATSAATADARIEALVSRGSVEVEGAQLPLHPETRRFYESVGYRPVWASPVISRLTEAIEEASLDGLDPAAYHLAILRAAGDEPANAGKTALWDVIATDALLRLSEHLLRGRIDPADLYGDDWLPTRRERDLVALLSAAAAAGDPAIILDEVRPRHPSYHRLRTELARWRQIAERPSLLPGVPIRAGARDTRVPEIRERLRILGDYAGTGAAEPDVLDAALAAAITAFQKRHGLDPTGALDNETRWLLNGRNGATLQQIAANLERWRWLPDDLGTYHLLVNIPAYELIVHEEGRTVMRMRVVVGRPDARTPVLSDTLRSITFNPTWAVPRSLIPSEVMVHARREGAAFLIRRRYTVFRGDEVIDPRGVDWASARTENYGFIQGPHPTNPMGQVKFNLSNPFDIFLHDTNERQLLSRAVAAYSSGCVRLERALDLSAWMLRHWSNWQADDIQQVLRRPQPEYVAPRDRWDVHLVYFTAWVDEDGTVMYSADIYGHDAALVAALAP